MIVRVGERRTASRAAPLVFPTARGRVDRVCGGDGERIETLLLDPVVRRYLGGPATPERAAAIAEAATRDESGGCTRAVRLARSERLVGLLFLSPHHDGPDTEISYLFDPVVWGRGLAAETLRGVLSRAKGDLGLDRIVSETQEANTASRRLLESVGMRPVRRLERFGMPQVLYGVRTT